MASIDLLNDNPRVKTSSRYCDLDGFSILELLLQLLFALLWCLLPSLFEREDSECFVRVSPKIMLENVNRILVHFECVEDLSHKKNPFRGQIVK